MGKLITVVGNSGVGKTTLTQLLCQRLPLYSALEQHAERPYQRRFSIDLTRYSLQNQVDYLLFRSEQESEIRAQAGVGIQDGGLDEDYYVFTRHFHNIGYLSYHDIALCTRLHALARRAMPPPDLVIRLVAPLDVLVERFARRDRPLEIAGTDDLAALEVLLDDWLSGADGLNILTVDAASDDPTYSRQLPEIVQAVERLMA